MFLIDIKFISSSEDGDHHLKIDGNNINVVIDLMV